MHLKSEGFQSLASSVHSRLTGLSPACVGNRGGRIRAAAAPRASGGLLAVKRRLEAWPRCLNVRAAFQHFRGSVGRQRAGLRGRAARDSHQSLHCQRGWRRKSALDAARGDFDQALWSNQRLLGCAGNFRARRMAEDGGGLLGAFAAEPLKIRESTICRGIIAGLA
ncbi:hypothetical protein CV_1689 [Chromobacterium violaceum ATCC 12472]|uniref:Uncharacterized protein n=1 Tax=Chromobacterium violaceum (strain ATCC 12472 / DSM 30191 / JCM 1249 / CCUG 213 / NBRC 12614 / NCIMB 9131 / NCTC 9757 / MK) TaxID=243365 RepID=Q7NXD8_CHRVO|nr:hypothetical protein CV_1689 [Chromobacterium violaceum ATCC 12472]